MLLLAFTGARGGRVAPGWQTVFTWTEAGGRRGISDGQRRKGSDGTGTRAALSRGFESLALAGAIERDWSGARAAPGHNQQRGDAD